MPHLNLVTNVEKSDTKTFVLALSKLAAKVLKKPEEYISVRYTYNENFAFGGTFEPAFQLFIMSLDNLNPEANGVYSKALFEFFTAELGIPDHRGYIVFDDPSHDNLGYRGKTFKY